MPVHVLIFNLLRAAVIAVWVMIDYVISRATGKVAIWDGMRKETPPRVIPRKEKYRKQPIKRR